MVLVLYDGVSFDLKTNMPATLTKTKAAIKDLAGNGVEFATFEFYDIIKGEDDDRKGDMEYPLYNPVIRMDFNADYKQGFVKKLSSVGAFECKEEDKPVCKIPVLDLIYVIDRSKSINETDIATVKEFLKLLSRKVMTASKDTWIGALSYNNEIIPELNLQGNEVERDIEGIVKAIDDIPVTTSDGTYTHKALKHARTEMHFLDNENNRANASNLIILITDGVTNIKPYLSQNPKTQNKYSPKSISEAKQLTPGRTDLITIGLPNMPALRLIEEGKKIELGEAKIKAGKDEWEGMIKARYPGDMTKLETNLFMLDKMEDMLVRFDMILETVCTMQASY